MFLNRSLTFLSSLAIVVVIGLSPICAYSHGLKPDSIRVAQFEDCIIDAIKFHDKFHDYVILPGMTIEAIAHDIAKYEINHSPYEGKTIQYKKLYLSVLPQAISS